MAASAFSARANLSLEAFEPRSHSQLQPRPRYFAGSLDDLHGKGLTCEAS